MRTFTLTLAAFVLAFVAVSAAADRPPTLYERLTEKLERNPKLAESIGKPAPEMAQVAWLIGEWDITAKVFATPKSPERVSQGVSKVTPAFGGIWLQFADTYGATSPDLTFLTYSPARNKWLSATVDDSTNAVVTTAERWISNRLVFSGPPVEILGETATLRQTMERISDREYHVLNEERLSDGSWVAVDEYRYKKR